MAIKKAKDWLIVLAPKYFGEKDIGKSLAAEPESVIGRRFAANAIELTNDFNKYYLKFFFRVVKVEGKKAHTEFDGFECTRDYISRMVLYHVRRIDIIKDLLTKDGIKLRVKTLIITPKGIGKKSLKDLKEAATEKIVDFVKSNTVEDLIKKILTDELKNKSFQDLRKIYPIRYFEIRKVEVLR
jgi:small subunit ribosomal protein S3Ae